jgi:hypothetical protein
VGNLSQNSRKAGLELAFWRHPAYGFVMQINALSLRLTLLLPGRMGLVEAI